MPFPPKQSGNPGGRSRPAGVAEWRKGPAAKRLRTLSYWLLEDAVAYGYVGSRMPIKRDDGSVAYGEWVYEPVDPKDRIAAARELLDRTDGKAPAAPAGDDGDLRRKVIELQIQKLEAEVSALSGGNANGVTADDSRVAELMREKFGGDAQTFDDNEVKPDA